MYLLIHAYSRKNSGDGLLVDLSREVLSEAAKQPYESTTLVCDEKSFQGEGNIYSIDIDREGFLRKAIASITTLFKLSIFSDERLLPISLRKNLKNIDCVVAVGGGYLRTGGLKESIKTIIAHGPQLKFAANSQLNTIYLPQSIGPLRGFSGALLKMWLKRIDIVCVRDDLTYKQLDASNVVRYPDLAVQELARKGVASRAQSSLKYDTVYLIARDIRGKKRSDYIQKLKVLIEKIPGIVPILQSEGRGNDDAVFYKLLGFNGPFESVASATKNRPGVVVSVRLHGAIQSLICGCPSIHLSYERKGFGAYSDLDILPYVHNCTTFDPTTVVEQIGELSEDASEFWGKIAAAESKVLKSRSDMVARIHALIDIRDKV